MEDDWDDELLAEIDDLEALHLQAAAQRQAAQQHHHHDVQLQFSNQQQWACKSCTLLNASTRGTCSVCGTPRGQTFDPRAATTANTTANAVPTPPPHPIAPVAAKKTVQATLPFGQPRPPASGTQPVPAPPPDAFWHSQQQQHTAPASRRQQQSWRPSPASSPELHRPPVASSASTATPRVSPYFPTHPPPTPKSATANATTANDAVEVDDDPDPDAFNAHAWPIAYAAQQRRSGEDPQAKTRYLDVLSRTSFPAIDLEAAHQFVYPTNYPIREYQLAIAEKALYHNTLVSLPTGLGKTLIASVVMYNFYRWFPLGKIVFMAPTKPLVAQQIQACHEIMGIPLADTAELQGNVPPATRKLLWRDKRVFFCTPQSMQNDLRHGVCEAERFVCLVVDEAHRATGNYAYCGVIHEVTSRTPFFRVLALSATPGAKFEIIQDVIRNLRISHIESRSADDSDVKKYTHARQEEVIKCTLSAQITDVKAVFLRVFDRVTNRLVTGNILQHRDPEKLSRWYVLQMRERFRQSPTYQANRAAESDLALLVSLLHAKELLTVHGISSFHEYVNGWIEERESGARLSWSKKEMMQSTEFHTLVLALSALGMDTHPAGASGRASSAASISHPKLLKLREVLHEHFTRHATGQSSTRAIVFTQYRTSVTEIVGLLEPLAPLLKVQAFVGQGASGKAKESKGQSQKQQQEIVRKFRDGAFNVLVATCIAEEGLDIGEVDLIVSFDALTSPVRMIQRMGRTGRKRVGRVIILVTEGDEEKKLARSVASAKTVSRAMTTFKSKFQYAKCPRMIPLGLQPVLSKLEMTIPEFHASQVGGKQRQPRVTGSARQRASETLGDESVRRRWQLNDIEKAIGNARYISVDWRSRLRHPIVPVLVRPQSLLRAVQVTVCGKERHESDTFLVGHSTRSLALRSLVRRIHGVEDESDEVVVEPRSRSESESESESVSQASDKRPSSRIRANGRQGPTSDSHTNDPSRYTGDGFPFSVAEDGDRTLDASFVTQGVHFSPEWNDSVSPVDVEKEASAREAGECQQPAAHASPVRTLIIASRAPVLASAPLSPAVAAPVTVKKTTPRPVQSRPEATAVSARSPGSKTKTALSSPPAKTSSKRERGKRSDGDHHHAAAKDAVASDGASEFERGELLLERLRELVAEAEAAAASDAMCSPEPEAVRHSQSTATGSQPTKAPQALPSFPRITRRLDFETAVVREELGQKRFGSTENCVPEAPSLDRLLPPVLAPPSPELPLEDEPVFTLLSTAGAGEGETGAERGANEDVVMVEEPEPSVSEKMGVNSSKPRRSLALKKTIHYAESAEVAPPAPLPASPVHAAPSQGFTVMEVVPPTVRAAPAPPRRQLPPNKSLVVDVDDFDDDVEVVLPPPVASAPASGKRQVTVNAVPVVAPALQRSGAVEATARLATTQTDCCSVCMEVESYEDDPIVYCDGCELSVHQFCYGIASLPTGSWYCDSCATTQRTNRASVSGASFKPPSRLTCALCPLRGGAMKPTQCGRWAHVQCFMWLPELRLDQDCDVLSLGSLANLDPDRNTLACSLCHSRNGCGVIQCAYKRCLVAFHVSCAAFAHYSLVQEEQEDGGDTLFLAYCPLHGRRRQTPHGGATGLSTSQPRQEQPTPAKPSAPNTASPSALLFSPEDHDSAKKFRKFRRLKRKYDASQRSQSPGRGAPTTATPGERSSSKRLSWGKHIKRSQHYSEGKLKHAAAMARLFIEDDVEVHGDDDGDEYDDMDDDDDASAHDDSFINDSSQLLYSQSSPESARQNDSSKQKKRKRESLGDMRAIYAKSLLESQLDTPAFARRGRRDFRALPQNGIINACLQELRNAPSPAFSAASLVSPPSVKSVGMGGHQSPISLLSPSESFVTPEPGRRTHHRTGMVASSIPPHPLNSAKRAVSETRAAAADEDDFELDVPEPPPFSLLPTSLTASASLKRTALPPTESVVLLRSPTRPRELEDGLTKLPSALDDDRTLQERIEANRLKALEKLRERQRRLTQAPPQRMTPVSARLTSTRPSESAPPPNAALSVEFSQGNAVPEAPSFSLFPALSHESISEARTIDLTMDPAKRPVTPHFQQPQAPPQQCQSPLSRSCRPPPQILIHICSSFVQTAVCRALLAGRPPDAAVEIEDLLEADALVSARLAVVVATPTQLSAALLRNESEFLAALPRLHACVNVFKRVVLVVHTSGDASRALALTQSLAWQRLGPSLPTVDVVVRASTEQLSQHLFDAARCVQLFLSPSR